jgi:hypothetical protein
VRAEGDRLIVEILRRVGDSDPLHAIGVISGSGGLSNPSLRCIGTEEFSMNARTDTSEATGF